MDPTKKTIIGDYLFDLTKVGDDTITWESTVNWDDLTLTTNGTPIIGSYDASISQLPGISNKIELRGPDADIVIDGVSIVQTLKSIESRLNLLRPNLELESQWDQLRELGERYRTLEAELMQKQQVWETLKKTSKPDPFQ